jgi:hypothetical protein
MQTQNYTNYKDLKQVLEVVKNIKEEDFDIRLLKSYENASYFNPTIKINGEHKILQFDIKQVNLKFKPQTQAKDGKWTKVKASFMIEKDDVLGEIFTILSEKVEKALSKDFQLPISTIIQTTITKKNEKGIPVTSKIENPIGWIVLKNLMKKNLFDKQKFGGSVVIIKNNEKGASKLTLTNPTFAELNKHWEKRALVSGTITVENFTVLEKSVQFTVAFTNKPIVVLPVPSSEAEDKEMVDEMLNYAVTNSIHTISDIEDEKTDDFSTN